MDIVQRNLHRGYHDACQELIETAAARWQEEEGDYRDDVSTVEHLLLVYDMKPIELAIELCMYSMLSMIICAYY